MSTLLNDQARRVLLLLAPCETSFSPVRRNLPPLAFGTLQAYLRACGHQVVSHDLNLAMPARFEAAWAPVLDKHFVFDALESGSNLDAIERLYGGLLSGIDPCDFDLIGISMGGNFSLFEIHSALLIGKLLKARYGLPVVLGGTNVTYLYLFRDIYGELWEPLLREFPYVIMGPGERPFAELIAALAAGTAEDACWRLKGAVHRRQGAVTANDEDLPSLVRPDFTGLALDGYSTCVRLHRAEENDVDFFKLPFPLNLQASEANRRHLPAGEKREAVFLPYIFNHHCPYNCAFCEESNERKRIPCSKDAEAVFADLAGLSEAHETHYFHFFNNCFNYRPSFVRDLCTTVIQRQLELRWGDCARASGLTKPLLELMYAAGCRKLVFGLETASPRLLKYIDKRITLQQMKNVLTWCADIGIWADLEVIVGFPYELEDDFQATYRFLEENLGLINCFYLNRYFVVPSSLMGTYPERYGIRLVRVHEYGDLVSRSARALTRPSQGVDPETLAETNFHLYSFDEVGGRAHAQVLEETKNKVARMSRLLTSLPVFRQARAAAS